MCTCDRQLRRQRRATTGLPYLPGRMILSPFCQPLAAHLRNEQLSRRVCFYKQDPGERQGRRSHWVPPALDAPTFVGSSSLHCDCNVGLSAPEAPAGDGIPGHLCCQSKCCCTRGHPTSCWDRLLCCAARAVFVCMVWGLCPCAFSSLSPLYRILRFPLPPFLHTLVVAAFPGPGNVDTRILLCNLEPLPGRPSLQAL